MSAATAGAQTNPFPGLRPFREDEEHLFFGRENQVDAMVNKLADTHFLAVIGTSGSGKSSLVNCGLRPALHQGLMARAGTAWRMAQFRPGTDPIGAMARALAQERALFREPAAAGLSLAELVETSLRLSKLGLIDIYEQAALDQGVNLLVVVDQFEELFRYRQLQAAGRGGKQGVGADAAAFVNLLLEVKEQANYPIYVVLTMRSDFLGDCTQFPGLAEAINAGQYLVPRMTRDERRAAVSGPIAVGGAEISPVLLTRLVNDVGDNPDQLSILQHALNRTWARWESAGGNKGPLSLTDYEAIGTMAHALDRHAEKAYGELATPRQQRICEKLFKALTDKASDSRGVRRPTSLGTLCALADATQAEMMEVMEVFRKPSRSFLMPPAGEVLEAKTTIDISHESLMRIWRRLNVWADEEARSAWSYRRVADAAALHEKGEASLLRDPGLQLALNWRDKERPTPAWAQMYHEGFERAMRFLEASAGERRKEEALVRQTLQREHEEALANQARQRELRNKRIANLGFAILLILATTAAAIGVLSVYSVLTRAREAEQQDILVERLGSDIATRLLEARRREKDFLLRWDKEGFDHAYDLYASQVFSELAHMRQATDELTQLLSGKIVTKTRILHEEAARMKPEIDAYERGFRQVVDSVRARGFTDTGLEGQFRRSAHAIEGRLLREGTPPTLMITMLELRRHEKDYLLRKQDEYAELVRNSIARLDTQAKTSHLPAADVAVLTRLANDYREWFLQIVEVEHRIADSEESFRAAARAIEPLAIEIAELGRAEATEARTQAERQRDDLLRLILVAMGGIIAVELIFAVGLLRKLRIESKEERVGEQLARAVRVPPAVSEDVPDNPGAGGVEEDSPR